MRNLKISQQATGSSASKKRMQALVDKYNNFIPQTGPDSPREKNLNQAYNQARDARLLDSGFNAHRKVRNKVDEKISDQNSKVVGPVSTKNKVDAFKSIQKAKEIMKPVAYPFRDRAIDKALKGKK